MSMGYSGGDCLEYKIIIKYNRKKKENTTKKKKIIVKPIVSSKMNSRFRVYFIDMRTQPDG